MAKRYTRSSTTPTDTSSSCGGGRTETGPEREPDLEQAIGRIDERNPSLRAFVSTRLDRALQEHAELRNEPPRSSLHGAPFSLKDTWDVGGEITTGGSHRYRDRVPPAHSPVYEVFRDAGAVLVGKTNLSDLMLFPESANYVGGVVSGSRSRSGSRPS